MVRKLEELNPRCMKYQTKSMDRNPYSKKEPSIVDSIPQNGLTRANTRKFDSNTTPSDMRGMYRKTPVRELPYFP